MYTASDLDKLGGKRAGRVEEVCVCVWRECLLHLRGVFSSFFLAQEKDLIVVS